MIRILEALAVLLAVVCLLVVSEVASRRGRAAGLRADSIEVLLDSTRQVGGTYLRRALQAEAKATTLEDSLALKPKVVVHTTVKLVPFEVEVRVPVEVDPTTMDRVAHFDSVRQAPFTATIDVTLPPPPGQARLGLRVAVDPISLAIRATCSTKSNPATGLKTATILATGPDWATLELSDLTEDPAICNARRVSLSFPFKAPSMLVVGVLGILVGALVF